MANYIAYDDKVTGGSGPGIAFGVIYDNTSSGLIADNVQDAIDELCTDVSYKVSKAGDTMTGNLIIDRQNGTTTTTGTSQLILGNNIAEGTTGNSSGNLVLYGTDNYRTAINTLNTTGHKTISFPDNAGVVALTSDIPIIDHNLTSSITLTSGEEQDLNIDFVKTFSSRPDVTVSIFCPYGYPSYLAGTLKYVSTTGFTYCIKNSSESTLTVRLMWIAAL